jgi:hypothetical protein
MVLRYGRKDLDPLHCQAAPARFLAYWQRAPIRRSTPHAEFTMVALPKAETLGVHLLPVF